MKATTVPALIDARAAYRLGDFAVELTGDQLAPRFRSGDILHVDSGTVPAPGSAVMATVGGLPCVMLLNGDGDLVDNAGGYVARGEFALIGAVVGVLTPE